MNEPTPFSLDAIHQAIASALHTSPLPSDKRFALIATASTDGGVQAILATKVDDRWTFSGEVEYHGGEVSAGASLIASW